MKVGRVRGNSRTPRRTPGATSLCGGAAARAAAPRQRRQAPLRVATRAGWSAFAAFLLTAALFVAPVIAGHPDFAHQHPGPIQSHVHQLSALLPALPAPSTPAITVVLIVLWLLAAARPSPQRGSTAHRLPGPRAPPRNEAARAA